MNIYICINGTKEVWCFIINIIDIYCYFNTRGPLRGSIVSGNNINDVLIIELTIKGGIRVNSTIIDYIEISGIGAIKYLKKWKMRESEERGYGKGRGGRH